MPELPEVEIVKQSLNKKIRGKIIQKVSVKNRNLRFKLTSNFEKKIRNKRIVQIYRFSKYIISSSLSFNLLAFHIANSIILILSGEIEPKLSAK